MLLLKAQFTMTSRNVDKFEYLSSFLEEPTHDGIAELPLKGADYEMQ